jgi:GAF domain-containing protein
MRKLGAASRAQAVAIAVDRGEIDAARPGRTGDGGVAAKARWSAVAAPGAARARAALAAGHRDAALARMLTELTSLYDIERGAVFVAEEDGLSLRRAALLEEDDSSDYPPQVALGHGPVGRAGLERRTQLLHGSRGAARTTINAPMVASGRLVGVISLATRPSRLTGRSEQLMLHALATQVAEILVARGDVDARLREVVERFRAAWLAGAASA